MKNRKAHRRGYTAVEVMISMTVFAIGTAGVIGMQRAAIQGTFDARRLDMGSAITREWIERLRADATLWQPTTYSNATPPSIAGAPLLTNLLAAPNGAWSVPSGRLGDPNPKSYAFDLLGRDLPLSQMTVPPTGQLAFCTNVRLTWVVGGDTIRAEVRTYWPTNLVSAPATQFCTNPPPANIGTQTSTYHFVYAETALRRNTL